MFNFFRKKSESSKVDNQNLSSKSNTESITIKSFKKGYLWGFTQADPMHHSNDKDDFYNLISLVTGENGTVTIGASFHPYQLVNDRGEDVWEQLFSVIQTNNFCDFEKLIQEKLFFHMTPPPKDFFPIKLWKDERLLTGVNPEFAQYVPVIIPYLTFENEMDPYWLTQLNQELATHGHAQNYISKINDASRFLLPEPTFIIGFGEFEKDNLKGTVDHFVNFLENSIKRT